MNQDKDILKTSLAVDIGNTKTNFSIIRKDKILHRYQIGTKRNQSDLKREVQKVIRWARKKYLFDNVIICSVVPRALKIVEKGIKSESGNNAIIVGRDVVVPIKNRYRTPKQVGQDRLVCCYAAMRLYGFPSIVVDLGTAITIDVISEKKEYLGGIIIPGIRLSAKSLYEETALLPMINFKKPSSLIGRDTEGSILSGLFYGYGVMIRGLIALLSRRFKKNPKVVITGGFSSLMRKFINAEIDIIDEDLVIKGLNLILKEQK